MKLDTSNLVHRLTVAWWWQTGSVTLLTDWLWRHGDSLGVNNCLEYSSPKWCIKVLSCVHVFKLPKIPTPAIPGSRGYRVFHRRFLSVSYSAQYLKTMQLGSPYLTYRCSTMNPEKPIYFGISVTSHKTSAGVGRCTLVSAGFLQSLVCQCHCVVQRRSVSGRVSWRNSLSEPRRRSTANPTALNYDDSSEPRLFTSWVQWWMVVGPTQPFILSRPISD